MTLLKNLQHLSEAASDMLLLTPEKIAERDALERMIDAVSRVSAQEEISSGLKVMCFDLLKRHPTKLHSSVEQKSNIMHDNYRIGRSAETAGTLLRASGVTPERPSYHSSYHAFRSVEARKDIYSERLKEVLHESQESFEKHGIPTGMWDDKWFVRLLEKDTFVARALYFTHDREQKAHGYYAGWLARHDAHDGALLQEIMGGKTIRIRKNQKDAVELRVESIGAKSRESMINAASLVRELLSFLPSNVAVTFAPMSSPIKKR